MKLNNLTLQELEMKRFDIREQLVLAKGATKRDLLKALERLNAEIGKRRKYE